MNKAQFEALVRLLEKAAVREAEHKREEQRVLAQAVVFLRKREHSSDAERRERVDELRVQTEQTAMMTAAVTAALGLMAYETQMLTVLTFSLQAALAVSDATVEAEPARVVPGLLTGE
jgi:alpha-ketoglutarate-dependent taurine dioxygenase